MEQVLHSSDVNARPFDHDGTPIDAVLLLSFGGPNGPEDVRPFLENVTRGRGIPPERLDEVGAHYAHFGGKSPLNELNLEIISNLEKELVSRGIDLPIYFGNRNWHPFLEDTMETVIADGHKHVLIIATSAWGGYSGSIQYEEDILRALEHVQDKGLLAPTVTKVPPFFDNPLFTQAYAHEVQQVLDSLSEQERENAEIVFTAHSIPTRADESSALPENGGQSYSDQVKQAISNVTGLLNIKKYHQVWQSRSGAPHIPWLEPDIVDFSLDHVQENPHPHPLVVVPIGFLSDHVEVEWDLDSDLASAISGTSLDLYRVPTIGPGELFITMLGDIVESYPTHKSMHIPQR